MVQIYTKLKIVRVDTILDLATGQGGFLEQLCGYFGNYTSAVGIDNSLKSISAASARETDPRISFREMDCENLEYENESFDVVSISNSLHHLKNRDAVLKEALRVLKKEGYFIVSEMYHSPDERNSQSTHSEFHHWWAEIDSALGNFHGKTFTREELDQIIRSLPLNSIEVEQYDGEDEDIYCEETKKQLINAFEMYRKKTEKTDNPDLFLDKGRDLLNKLDSDGFAHSSRLEYICRK